MKILPRERRGLPGDSVFLFPVSVILNYYPLRYSRRFEAGAHAVPCGIERVMYGKKADAWVGSEVA